MRNVAVTLPSTVDKGTNAKIECVWEHSISDEKEIIWHRKISGVDETTIDVSDSNKFKYQNTSIIIMDVKSDDVGKYWCNVVIREIVFIGKAGNLAIKGQSNPYAMLMWSIPSMIVPSILTYILARNILK